MTTNPCTACKHFKPELTCKLTGRSTSESRAYKTDKDDCFQSSCDKYEFHMGCDEWQDIDEFDSLEDAKKHAETVCKTMGLYTATFAFIRKDSENYFEDIEI